MLNNKDVVNYLSALGLSRDESKIYLELLKKPANHLELARATGVNRTKVYRLADQLEKRSLVALRSDDRGSLLEAADPTTLEVDLVNREEKLKAQRTIFGQLLPQLKEVSAKPHDPNAVSVQTYEGIDGFKQMLWHELKAKNEVLIFGNGTIDDLVQNQRWAEKHRAMTTEAGYKIREIINPGTKPDDFTKNAEFKKQYAHRHVSKDVLDLNQQIVIYNDTVATYWWRDGHKVGTEVINRSNADMMRQVFKSYWQLLKD